MCKVPFIWGLLTLMHLSPMATLQVSGMKRKIITILRIGNKENSPPGPRGGGKVTEQVCGSRVSIGGHLCSWGVRKGTARWGYNPTWSPLFMVLHCSQFPSDHVWDEGWEKIPQGCSRLGLAFFATSHFSPSCLQNTGSSSSLFANILFVIEKKWSQWGGENQKKKNYKLRTSKGTGEVGEWEREVCQSASSLETAFGVKGKSRLHHLTWWKVCDYFFVTLLAGFFFFFTCLGSTAWAAGRAGNYHPALHCCCSIQERVSEMMRETQVVTLETPHP